MKLLKKGIEKYLKDRCNAGFKLQEEKRILSQLSLF